MHEAAVVARGHGRCAQIALHKLDLSHDQPQSLQMRRQKGHRPAHPPVHIVARPAVDLLHTFANPTGWFAPTQTQRDGRHEGPHRPSIGQSSSRSNLDTWRPAEQPFRCQTLVGDDRARPYACALPSSHLIARWAAGECGTLVQRWPSTLLTMSNQIARWQSWR